jgi:hypothetical protein
VAFDKVRFISDNDKVLIITQTSTSRFRYKDEVLSLNNSRFGDYLHLIYLNELEVKDTTDTLKSVSYFGLTPT